MVWPAVPRVNVPLGLIVTVPVGLIATFAVGLSVTAPVVVSVVNLPAAAVVTPTLVLFNVPVEVGLRLKAFNVRFKLPEISTVPLTVNPSSVPAMCVTLGPSVVGVNSSSPL